MLLPGMHITPEIDSAPSAPTDRDSQEGFFPQLSYCSHGKHEIMLHALYMHNTYRYTQYFA